MSKRQQINFAFVCSILALVITGCGESTSTGTVSGTVIFKNRPVYPGKLLVKDSISGQSYSANLSQSGEFQLVDIKAGKYDVAVEPIRLGRAGAAPKNAPVADPNSENKLENREMGVPAQFRNANINFPEKFRKIGASGLLIDCSAEFPENPIEVVLK